MAAVLGGRDRGTRTPLKIPDPADLFRSILCVIWPASLQAVAYGSYVTTNHALYNFTRIATLIVGGASALSGRC